MLTTPTYYVQSNGDYSSDDDVPVDDDALATIVKAMTALNTTSRYILHVAAGAYADNLVISSSGSVLQYNQIIGDKSGIIFGT